MISTDCIVENLLSHLSGLRSRKGPGVGQPRPGMADYIYTMELRLTPNQQKGVISSGYCAQRRHERLSDGRRRKRHHQRFPIRDLDFTVQGNPLKLQKEFERSGAVIGGADDDLKILYLTLPGGVRAEISSARTERYEKTGKPPIIAPATIIEDLRRRDFTVMRWRFP